MKSLMNCHGLLRRLGCGYTQTVVPPTKDQNNFGNFIPYWTIFQNQMMKYPEKDV
jgi:hypothetical protein